MSMFSMPWTLQTIFSTRFQADASNKGHLPYLVASPKFNIVALCNTSVASAQAAVKRHNLPNSTKTYGSAAEIAADPDIDLVVCCVRVDRHHETIMPALRAGKNVFVEWPLAFNVTQAQEMLDAAKASGSRTIVGLQGRNSPYVQKVRDLVESKVIGELLSSSMEYTAGFLGDTEPTTVSYLTEKKTGANTHSILSGHAVDSVFFALGGLRDVSARLNTRWKQKKLLKLDGSFDRMLTRETPDHIMMYGTAGLNDAPVSVYVRAGHGFKGSPNLTWRVFGTKGEIRLTAMGHVGINMGGEKLELYDHEKDAVEEVDVVFEKEIQDLPPMSRQTVTMYKLFAEKGTFDQGLVNFEDAMQMQKVVAAMEKSSETEECRSSRQVRLFEHL